MLSSKTIASRCLQASGRRQLATSSAVWSSELSFASPESDFVQSNERHQSTLAASEWSGQITFASPESDFTQSDNRRPGHYRYSTYTQEQAEIIASMPEWSNAYSFASAESDFVGNSPSLDKKELINTLPKTFSEALQMEDAAIVVTTPDSPHYIVHVNEAWEGLCGFDHSEALYNKLDIIQGAESNTSLAQSVVHRVMETKKPHDAYLVNYSKDGRRFLNHVAMGPLFLNEEQHDVEFLVGILQEVDQSEVPLRMVSSA